MKISLQKLHQAAATRPPGYLEEVLAAGAVRDGYLHLTRSACIALRSKYSPIVNPRSQITGLGDVVALVAQPIARALDYAFKTSLKNCSGCSKRRAKLNSTLPFKRGRKPPA